jgi:hypothetical protein
MYKCQNVTKSGWLSIVTAALISFTGVPLASANSYNYSLTNLSGSITTNCDNCVLNSSDITAWSMSLPASAPELDPASLVGGLTLLFGLVAVVRGRRPQASAYA